MSPSHNTPHSFESTNAELIARASQTVETGLMFAYEVHESLGPEGVEAKRENRFHEMALEADVASEAAIIDVLKTFGMPITVHSEEHGILELNPDTGKNGLLAVIDGLDGSSVYQKERGTGRYGTMFTLFENDNPQYKDYLATGILLHTDKTILLAVAGKPLQSINIETGEITFPQTDQNARLQPGAIAYADKSKVAPENSLYDFFTLNTQMADIVETATGAETKRTGSTAANIGAVACGEAALDLGATRKGNLEYATGYAIVTAAGGVVETVKGEDIGDAYFLKFGQNEHVPVIVAANKGVAQQVQAALSDALPAFIDLY